MSRLSLILSDRGATPRLGNREFNAGTKSPRLRTFLERGEKVSLGTHGLGTQGVPDQGLGRDSDMDWTHRVHRPNVTKQEAIAELLEQVDVNEVRG